MGPGPAATPCCHRPLPVLGVPTIGRMVPLQHASEKARTGSCAGVNQERQPFLRGTAIPVAYSKARPHGPRRTPGVRQVVETVQPDEAPDRNSRQHYHEV